MSGKLVLIGCGPGAADLLTLRAIRRIQAADLILHDRLVNPELLAYADQAAACEYVGKEAGDGGRQQVGINRRLTEALGQGQTVVRLKSGDPLIFGRAAEEIETAENCGAEVEIVPGITSSLAAASEAMVAVTERAELQSFVMTTGRTASDDTVPDWVSSVRPGVCVAFYMSVARAWKIQSTLMASGVPGVLPSVWVEKAGCPDMRTIESRLDRLAMDAESHNVANPAILLVRYPNSLAALLGKKESSTAAG